MQTTRAAKQCGCAKNPLRYLTRIGLWGDANGWLRRYSPTLALAQAVYGLGTQVINVAQTRGKMVVAAEYCVAFLQMSMTCVKIRCLLANTGKIQEVVTTLDKLHDGHTKSSDVTDIRRRTRAASDKFAHVMHGLCTTLLLTFTLGVTVGGYFKHEIPYRRWYPFEAKASPKFELSLASYFVLTNFDYYLILVFDLLVLCLLIEVVGEFRVLQHRLTLVYQQYTKGPPKPKVAWSKKLNNEALDKIRQVTVKENCKQLRLLYPEDLVKIRLRCHPDLKAKFLQDKSSEIFQHRETSERRLVACVIQHNALISLVSKLEAMFQPALIIHLVCNFFVGLTLAFVTLKSEKLDIIMVNILTIGMVCIGEFALYCYFCTQITTESRLVGEALYSCAWWNADAGFKRSLRIVQLRTNQPLIIRAAAIFPMSMETFTKVMNTAYKMYGLMVSTN